MSRPGATSMICGRHVRARQAPADPGAEVAHGLRLQLVDEDERAQFGHQPRTSSRSSSRIDPADLVAGLVDGREALRRRDRRRPPALRSTARGRRSRRRPRTGRTSRRPGSLLIRCRGSRFSPSDERPKKPVPIVIVGARFVSRPAEPVLPPTLTATRSTLHRGAVGHDRARVMRVDDRRVAGAADAQHRAGGVDAARGVRHPHEPEQREELLARERLLGDDERERRDQDARLRRHPDPALLRQRGPRRARPGRPGCGPRGTASRAPRPPRRARARDAPWRASSRSNSVGARAPRRSRTDSFVHRIELSNAFESTRPRGGRGQVGGVRRRGRARCRGRRRSRGCRSGRPRARPRRRRWPRSRRWSGRSSAPRSAGSSAPRPPAGSRPGAPASTAAAASTWAASARRPRAPAGAGRRRRRCGSSAPAAP